MNRAATVLSLGLAVALSGCADQSAPPPPEYGVLRMKLFQQCMAAAKDATPRTIADRGSWSEVVSNCASAAYYVANTCDDERACLAALTASEASKGGAK